MSFNNASNPWDYSRNHFNNLYQTGVNAHKSGVKQAKMDVISVKNTVNTFLGTGAVGYIDGFGKSLGIWGK